MLAAKFREANRPLSLEYDAMPSISADEVLVEIKAAGICGSEIHNIKGDFLPNKTPLTLGHEGAGVIKDIGSNVSNVRIGDHVIIHYVISCGTCKPCLQGYDNRCRHRISVGHDVDGTFAEYTKIPSRNALRIADRVPFEWGAITGCGVSTGFHAVKKSGLKQGDTVAVFGAGGVGIHAVMWSKFFGAGKIFAVDPIESKLELARQYGADIVVNPIRQDVLQIVAMETDDYGVDVALECSGSYKAMEQAIRTIKGKNVFGSGTVVSVGLQTRPLQVEYWGLREGCLTVSGDHTFFDLFQIVKLIEANKIDLSESITQRIPLRDINEGIALIESNKEHVEKVVVDMEL